MMYLPKLRTPFAQNACFWFSNWPSRPSHPIKIQVFFCVPNMTANLLAQLYLMFIIASFIKQNIKKKKRKQNTSKRPIKDEKKKKKNLHHECICIECVARAKVAKAIISWSPRATMRTWSSFFYYFCFGFKPANVCACVARQTNGSETNKMRQMKHRRKK